MDIGPDHFAAQRCAICSLGVITVGVAVTGISPQKGHIRADAKATGLNGWRVIVNGDHQRTSGRIVIAIGHRITDIQGDIVFSATDRVHQWFQQRDGIAPRNRSIQHDRYQWPTRTADSQSAVYTIPARGNRFATQGCRPAEHDGFEPIRACREHQIAAGSDGRTISIAWPAVNATIQAFVIQNKRGSGLACSWCIVFEADHMTNVHAIDCNITVAVSHRDHGFNLATEALRLICAAAIWVLKGDVLRHTELAIITNGHSKGSLAIVSTAGHSADNQIPFDIKADRGTFGGFQPRIQAIVALQGQAQNSRCTLAILASTAARCTDYCSSTLRIANRSKTSTRRGHASKERRQIRHIIVISIARNQRSGCRILQTCRFIVRHAGVFHQTDTCSGAIVLKADHTANIDLVDRNITVAIGHGNHCLDFTSQVYRLVVAAAANRVLQRHVLRHAQRTIGTNGDSKGSLAGICPTHDTPNNQRSFKMQRDATTIGGTQTGVIAIAVFHNQAELGGRTFLIFAVAAAQGSNNGCGTLGKASRADVCTFVGNAIKYRQIGHIIIGNVAQRPGVPEILQAGRFIVGDIGPRAFEVNVRGGAVIFEADGTADIDLVDCHIAVTISHCQYCLYLASQADRFVITAAANRMLQRHILRHADRAIRTNGDGKGGLAGIRPAHDTTNDQIVLDIEFDGEASGRRKSRISAVTTYNGQTELGRRALLILSIAAASGADQRTIALCITFWREVATSVANAAEQVGNAIDVIVIGIFRNGWCCRGVLQAM